MSDNFTRLFFLFLFVLFTLVTFSQTPAIHLKKDLILAGYENVRIVEVENVTYISLEDNQYRWSIDGIFSALKIIRVYPVEHVKVVKLKNGIPWIEIDVKFQRIREDNNFPVIEHVSFDCKQSWNQLRNIPAENKPEYKIDIIFDPQLALKNAYFDQIYHVRFNVAPVIQTSIWKGMLVSGQCIIPIINSKDLEGNQISPGIITFSQNFRLSRNWFGTATIGNFSSGRYGADFNFEHQFGVSRWGINIKAGLTGLSFIQNENWHTGKLNTLTWNGGLEYYYPLYNLEMEISYGRYLNSDHAVRADCTRHFGATTIGFYAIYGEGPFNGGFHFSIPLAAHKSSRKNPLRLTPAKYFDQEYNAANEDRYYQHYESKYNENKSEQWFHPLFIKNELIKMIQNEKGD